jgi:hypothetical protein
MEKVSFSIEQDGQEEGDHHEGGPDHRDPSPRNEHIKEDTRDGQAGRQFLNRDREEEEFGTLQGPNQQREGKEGHDPKMIPRDGQEMGDPRDDEIFLQLIGNISLLAQDEGLEYARRREMRLPLQKISNMIPPPLDLDEDRILISFSDFNAQVSIG